MERLKHRELERYLTRATWGLWGRKRLEVRHELEASVRELALDLQLLGHLEPEALSLALERFGKPERISAGLATVYAMPHLMRSTVLFVLLAVTSLSSLTSSAAQVTATTHGPIPSCPPAPVRPNTVCSPNNEGRAWLHVPTLVAQLRAEGVEVRELEPRDAASDPLLEVRFPGDTPVTVRSTGIGYSLRVPRGTPRPAVGFADSVRFERDGDSFLDAGTMIKSLARSSGLPVRLAGWTNPVLMVGDTSLTLGTPATPMTAQEYLREQLVRRFAREGLPVGSEVGFGTPGDPPRRNRPVERQSVRVPGQPNDVYAILHGVRSGTFSGLAVDVAPVRSDGTLQFLSPFERVGFTRDLPALAVSGGKKPVVALLRLTGLLGSDGPAYEIVVPASR